MKQITDITRTYRDMRRDYKSEYAAASPGRFRRTRSGAGTDGASGDRSLANETRFFRAVEYIRAMHRDDGVVAQATRRATQQQVQGGFNFDPTSSDEPVGQIAPVSGDEPLRNAPPGPDTGDRGLNLALWEDFHDWATDPDRCDISGEREFADMEADAFYSMLRDGDILGLGTVDGQIQLIESHLVRTPSRTKKNVVLGVQLNDYRKRLGYHVVPETIDPYKTNLRVSDAPMIPTRNADGVRQVFHVLMPERVSLTRGISAWFPVVDTAGMFEDSNFALMVKNQMVSCLVVFLKQTMAGLPAYNPQTGAREMVQTGAGTTLTDVLNEELTPGLKMALPPGIEPEMLNPSIQASEAIAHLRFLLQILGLNLGMPLGILLLDPSDASWSGLRTVWDAAKIGFRCNQAAFARRWHKPIWKWRHHWRMAQDDSFAADLRRWYDRLGERLFSLSIKPPSWPYLQPLDDAKAKALKRSTLQTSPRRDAAESGEDFDDIVSETVSDMGGAIVMAKTRAAAINKEFPDDPSPVNWRDLLNLDLYKGGTQFDSRDVQDNTAGKSSAKAKQA